MAVRSVENEGSFTRLAVSASKRLGKAVVRNKVWRRLREAFRSLAVREGFDIVIVPRAEASRSDFRVLKAELELLLGRARLLERPDLSPGPRSA